MCKCNYFEYNKLVNSLFYGVVLTDEHLNNATEIIRLYIINGGAAQIMQDLGIGLRVVEKQFPLMPELNTVISRRFIYINGERKGKELTINEIVNIGMFLCDGPYYGYKKAK